MVRVSDCKYFVASVFASNIRIEKSEMLLEQKISNVSCVLWKEEGLF